MQNKNIAIIGFGRVGSALALLCQKNNIPLSVIISSKKIQAITKHNIEPASVEITTKLQALQRVDIIFIAAPDAAIVDVVTNIIKSDINLQHKTICHLSGALSSEILQPLQLKGATICSCHPILSFTQQVNFIEKFPGTVVSVEGEKKAKKIFAELFKNLGAECIEISTDKKIQYHAAFVFACNFMNILIESANTLLQDADFNKELANKLTTGLAQQTVNNIALLGPKQALTGPLARGDTSIIEQHIKVLEKLSPELKKLYEFLNEASKGLVS